MIGSPLASPAPAGSKRGRPRPPPGVQGLCVHTTGGTIVRKARRAGADPLEYALDFYLAPESYFPHYVCGWRGWRGGELVQVCDEGEIALHVGLGRAELTAYRDGSWRKRIDPARWDQAWSSFYPMPLRLYPGTTPNKAYVGLELLPLPEAGADGLYFTPEQHETAAELAGDILARYALRAARRRICGHEDLNPLTRWDGGGGWDPGARRARPRFDWSRVLPRLGL